MAVAFQFGIAVLGGVLGATLLGKQKMEKVMSNEIKQENASEYYCSNCGTDINESDKVCPKCGADFSDEVRDKMLVKIKKILPYFLFIVLIVLATIILRTSDKNDDEKKTKATIVDCNTIKYKGYTFTFSEINYGSDGRYTVYGNQSDHSYVFRISVFNGCITFVEPE